jgi:fructose-1,6-bisphosphatase
MSNETVTYSLEAILREIKDSIKEVSHKIGQAKLTEKVEGMDKRLEKVEGTQKNQVWTLIVLLAGAIGTAAWRSFFSGNP